MADYSIIIARSARKEIEALPHSVIGRIISKIDSLGRMPRPPGCRKLQGSNDLWRIRVGDYRVLYAIDDGSLIIDVIRFDIEAMLTAKLVVGRVILVSPLI